MLVLILKEKNFPKYQWLASKDFSNFYAIKMHSSK